MAMGGGINMRTIWITLRAVNYTQRVFGDIIKDIGKLMGEQMKLKKSVENLYEVSTKFIMAGMMFGSIALMMANTIWSTAQSTIKGAAEMASLRAEMEMAKIAMADTMYEFIKATGILDILHDLLNSLRSNPALRLLTLGTLIFVSAIVGLLGVLFLLRGAFGFVIGSMAQFGLFQTTVTNGTYSMIIANHTLQGSFVGLGLAISAAFAIFTILLTIGQRFGPWAALVVGAIMAICAALIKMFILESMSTLGFAAIMGGIAAGTAVGVLAGAGVLAHGTRSAQETGYAYLHKGEVVYNPSTGRPTQIANEIEGGAQGGRNSITTIPITIENVNTKANLDDLDEKLRKGLKRTLRERR